MCIRDSHKDAASFGYPDNIVSTTKVMEKTIESSNHIINESAVSVSYTHLLTDSRGKKCRIEVVRKQGKGRWAICSDSAYITTGTELVLHKVKETGKEKNYVGELLPSEPVSYTHLDVYKRQEHYTFCTLC